MVFGAFIPMLIWVPKNDFVSSVLVGSIIVVAFGLMHVPKGLGTFLSDCETLLLEANHDPDMLETGPYPDMLKRRVAGSLGHLSNGQAGDVLAGLAHAPKRVVLMHLSETNNSPRLARNSAEAALGHQSTELLLAQQQQPLELGAMRDLQLQLGL